jgi:hypothetical protein
MDKEHEPVTEKNLVVRIPEGISGGYYPNAWFLHQGLPKAFREQFSYRDVLDLFHKLEWNVEIIEISSLKSTTAYCPWLALGYELPKKLVVYGIRPEFENWKHNPKILDAVLDNLHDESPTIKLDPRV